jgi:hypothetical protein
VNKPRTVINPEETIGKQVGRRKPPTDPLQVANEMNRLPTGLLDTSEQRLSPRGVFRFHTHEEAEQWLMTHGRKAKS